MSRTYIYIHTDDSIKRWLSVCVSLVTWLPVSAVGGFASIRSIPRPASITSASQFVATARTHARTHSRCTKEKNEGVEPKRADRLCPRHRNAARCNNQTRRHGSRVRHGVGRCRGAKQRDTLRHLESIQHEAFFSSSISFLCPGTVTQRVGVLVTTEDDTGFHVPAMS